MKTSRTACSLAPIYLLSNSGPQKVKENQAEMKLIKNKYGLWFGYA